MTKYFFGSLEACIAPGCKQPVRRLNLRERPTCKKHRYAVFSGRVHRRNTLRDIHNFHRKGRCGCCGITPMEAFNQHIKPFLERENPEKLERMKIRDKIKMSMTMFHGDHINGRNGSSPNDATNIQTLCARCHVAKSLVFYDYG